MTSGTMMPPNPVILFDMEYQGDTRKAIAEAGKTGWVYILDRVTGEPIIGIEEKPVPQLAGATYLSNTASSCG